MASRARAFPSLAVPVLAAALGLHCATRYTWVATVPLPGPVEGECLMAALDSEDDVLDLVRTAQDGLEFRLRLPDRKPKDAPSFSLETGPGPTGAPALSLSTDYAEGVFEADQAVQLDRARRLVADVTEGCTGRRPRLGEAHPCGRGEKHDLCVDGSF